MNYNSARILFIFLLTITLVSTCFPLLNAYSKNSESYYVGVSPNSTIYNSTIFYEWLSTYKTIVVLSREGVNTSNVTRLLSKALILLESNENSKAQALLKRVKAQVARLMQENPYLSPRFLSRITAIIIFIIIPILFYCFFPRLYLEIWFRTKRRRVVRSGSA